VGGELTAHPSCVTYFAILGDLKPIDDALPLDFGFLEIDKKTQGPARGSQIVETLRGVFVGETLDTFQLDD
jgi:hypothetical protein